MDQKLSVEKSLGQSRWRMADVDMNSVEQVVRRYDLPEVVARLLLARGVEAEMIPAFLNPTLKDNFPDPFSLAGMHEMAEGLAGAIENGKNIAIFGDFDVDGATSSATLFRYLKGLGIVAPIYIPDRLSEGYGPNIEALRKLKEQGTEILMMLDCGTTAFDVVQAGADMGLKIVILDHHEAEENLPSAWHIINPKRKDDTSGLTMLAAVGVTFMSCVAINNRLRERGFFKKNNIKEPDLRALLDIVALGTVCDMVPLTSINRLLVRLGLSMSTKTTNPGLLALMQVSGVTAPISTYDAGFALGPRINAGSRIHKADLGARLLCTDDPEEASNIAWMLNDCNDKRKDIQQQMEQEAIHMVESGNMQNDPLILVDHEDWHPGLAGLVAGRLKEKYAKPSCVVTYAHDLSGKKEGRGSGRSVPGIHIAQAFIDARAAGFLEKGGGHAMAGGFTVLPEKLPELREFLKNHIKAQIDSDTPQIETEIDGVLTVRGATTALISLLQDHIGPFGQNHAEPLFVFPNVRIVSVDVLKNSHVRVMISGEEGGARLKAMAFRAVGTPLGDALLKEAHKAFHIAGHLKLNEWQGRVTPEMHIQDAAFAKAESTPNLYADQSGA
ncbi:MAG: single-stranded-DNA-specific exonuclease RecJ [Alphaproteobacteria bacterium]|nr:single-stranded-DNA-specific exonuclease RecJ [Alphaproteobacteria bacterium]